jgi:hypothetical protein
LRVKHPDTGIVIQESGKQEQKKKPVIPGAIKEITRYQQNQVLKSQVLWRYEPVNGKDNRKKYEK